MILLMSSNQPDDSGDASELVNACNAFFWVATSLLRGHPSYHISLIYHHLDDALLWMIHDYVVVNVDAIEIEMRESAINVHKQPKRQRSLQKWHKQIFLAQSQHVISYHIICYVSVTIITMVYS
jgi:hypothetical protein